MWGRGEKPSSCRIWRWEGGPCGFICYQDRDIEYPPCDTEHAHLRTKVALSSLYSQDLWILWIGSLHWLIEGALCFFQGIIYNLEKVLCHLMSRISLIRFCFQSRIVNISTGLRSNLEANWMRFQLNFFRYSRTLRTSAWWTRGCRQVKWFDKYIT